MQSVLLEAPGHYFKPHPALGLSKCHGLGADEYATGEDDHNHELCFGTFFCALGSCWSSWPCCMASSNKCARSAHVVHWQCTAVPHEHCDTKLPVTERQFFVQPFFLEEGKSSTAGQVTRLCTVTHSGESATETHCCYPPPPYSVSPGVRRSPPGNGCQVTVLHWGGGGATPPLYESTVLRRKRDGPPPRPWGW